MKRKSTLGVVLALAAAAPAVFVPKLVPQAAAQPAGAQPADYPDVPQGHWAYAAINKLSQAGIIEGRPGGNYVGNEPMTRYEFAVAIARLLERSNGGPGFDASGLNARIAALEARPIPDISRAQVLELINALQTEFRDELGRLGVRVTAIEDRLSTLENRVTAPPRQTFTPAVLHRTGYTNYISAQGGRAIFNGANGIGVGTNAFAANIPNLALLGGQAVDITLRPNAVQGNPADKKFAYTDLELRLTDRVTDRLTASAALRSLGSTQEDPWTGDSQGGVYVRELYGVADLSDRSILSIKGLSAVLGRQRTKIAQGLLYDNDFAPTDQIKGLFRIGPIGVQAFVGTSNNQNTGFLNGGGVSSNPYTQSGSVQYLGNSNGSFGQGAFGQPGGAAVGFPGQSGVATLQDDNESLVRVNGNLFQISGQPVTIGATRQFDGVGGQRGDSFDLTLPLFNRTVGFEYVKQHQYANGANSNNSSAYIATVPILRTNFLDLNGAYGKAKDGFEYFISSAANPFARSYGEALFDRPLFLGAPMINGNGGSINGGSAPLYMAAKKGYDFNGTLRAPLPILRRIPLDFRIYRARGTGDVNLGSVFTVGTTFNVTPGVDLELKYGRYNVPGPTESIRYLRAGANIGF